MTVDDIIPLNDIVNSLKSFKKKMTVRIVFDQSQSPPYYKNAVQKISEVGYVMGQILDSSAMKNFTVDKFKKRTDDYLKQIPQNIEIWEIGNEINGEWLGPTPDTVEKINYAFAKVKEQKQKTALTLFYNDGCYEKPENEMFTWISKNISTEMKNNLDYVLVSYYEDDCKSTKPNWQDVFQKLHTQFPNSKIGFGETGTKHEELKSAFLKEFYGKNIQVPGYIGGYFWWYYVKDMVPSTKPLWSQLNSLL
ncbi:MAG: glycosyl hydrolase 53 family protein [Pseudobdellovibrio sp.]